MQHYKSLCAAVRICAILVNIQTHREHSDQLISIAQAAALKPIDSEIFCVPRVSRKLHDKNLQQIWSILCYRLSVTSFEVCNMRGYNLLSRFLLFCLLPERDYVTFGYAIANPSVCLSSVTLVHPTKAVETFGNISSPFGTLATQNFMEIVLRAYFSLGR